MLRIGAAGVIGFVLLYIESVIVMHLKGMDTIVFGGITPFINVWAMNFFFVFAILTQVLNWLKNRTAVKEGEQDEMY